MSSNLNSKPDEAAVTALYHDLLAAWNRRSAAGFAGLFADEAFVVGFDGSMMNNTAEIETQLGHIFRDHVTAAYLGKIRSIRFIGENVAILRAVAGMRPPGGEDINPAVNTIQSLVAVKGLKGWQIALFQNTPAQFHGRPDLSSALTEELRQLLQSGELPG